MNRKQNRTAIAVAFAIIACFLLISTRLLADTSRLPALEPVGTLVPPTLVPTIDSGMTDALLSDSTVKHLQDDGALKVGILYNEPPFGSLNLRGEVSGFDADLARAIGDAWGVKVEFTQVTRQTALDTLLSGKVDALIAAQVHRRDLDNVVEFSDAYYPGAQMMMVRDGDGATVLGHMAQRKVGVVIGTPGEAAVADWLARTHLPVQVLPYLTLDQALVALRSQEVDGVVESRLKLSAAVTDPSVARFVDEPVSQEPYAVVMRRQDINMRELVNRTLQFLVKSGKMTDIYKANFNGAKYPADMIPEWSNVGDDAPKPAQFGTDVPYPRQTTIPRLQSGGTLRVAGLGDPPTDDADESVKRLDTFYRSLIQALASRWGVPVEYVPNSTGNALDLVASGDADLAIGVEPDWNSADKVDFSDDFLLHGNRLMIKKDSNILGFTSLRGKWVGVFDSEPGVTDIVNGYADEVKAKLNIYHLSNEKDAAFGMLAQANYDAAFGDSLKLIAHLEANADTLELVTNDETGGWYSRHYNAFALPRNDIDFRLLVDYTLQELSRDNTLGQLLLPVMPPGETIRIPIWPGPSDYLGYHLSSSAPAQPATTDDQAQPTDESTDEPTPTPTLAG